MSNEKIKMYDDPNLVQYRTNIEGWVASDGRYWGKDEHMARWTSCTHKTCECGNIHEKSRTKCNDCIEVLRKERYLKLPITEWDGVSMISDNNGNFWSEIEDALEYFEENEIEINQYTELYLCELSNGLSEIDLDGLNDEECTEDEGASTFYPEIAKKVDELNKLIRETPGRLWFPTKTRIDLSQYKTPNP